jgi:hypothetical protein
MKTVNDEGIVPISSSVFNLPDELDKCCECGKSYMQSDMLDVGCDIYKCFDCLTTEDRRIFG